MLIPISMDEEKDILSRKFRERLENYEIPLNKDIWAGIEADLPKKRNIPTQSLWMKRCAVAAMLVLVLLSGWYLKQRSDQAGVKFAGSLFPLHNDFPDTTSLFPSAILLPGAGYQTGVVRKVPASQSKDSGSLPVSRRKDTLSEEVLPDPVSGRQTEVAETEPPAQAKQPDSKDDLPDLWEYPAKSIPSAKKKKQGNLSLALAYGSQGTSPASPDVYAPDVYADAFPTVYQLNSNAIPSSPATSDISYKMPLSFSLLVRKSLSSGWALETGLTYTYLESTETLIHADKKLSSSEIQLHYLGIPLKTVFTVFQRDRLSIYVSAGGMLEKCVYGKEIFSKDLPDHSLDIPELQWSLSGGAGLNYRLAGQWALFAEPGVAYYFDDHSDVMTIRKDKPWNFNIQAGVRVTY